MPSDDPRVPPDIPALLRTLADYRVDYILSGSISVQAWGADVGTPGDLDIVPATDSSNLARLATVMQKVEARSWPVTGRWVEEGNEVRWQEFVDDDPRRGQPLPEPDPDDVSTFDSLFSTRHGELDIVPRIIGTYDWLLPRAVRMSVHGVDDVLVTHVDDLLGYLTVPRRKKDAQRVATLRDCQRRLRNAQSG